MLSDLMSQRHEFLLFFMLLLLAPGTLLEQYFITVQLIFFFKALDSQNKIKSNNISMV
jgi:hypothetical protein